MPENDPQPDTQDQQEPQEEEEEPEEDTDETIPYRSTDTDETLDYTDLVIDDSKWCFLSQEQKLCSNTASFSVPRLIDGSPVALSSVESSNSIGMSYSVVSERQRTRCRKTRSDIIEEYHGINDEDKAFMTLYSMTDKFSYLAGKKRKEATQQEKRQLAKQFLDAKKAECQSWIDNEVFDLVDMRKTRVRNFVAGRWVLTVKKDKDGNSQKCKARWVLKGFQDKKKNTQQTDSPAASRAGFRCATQLAANYRWDLYQMDLKTAFLQGEAYMMKRETSFARYHPNTATRRISVLGLRNLATVLMMRHAVGGRLLIKPYLIVDLFPHAQIDVHMFCMTVLPRQKLINHLAVSVLNR